MAKTVLDLDQTELKKYNPLLAFQRRDSETQQKLIQSRQQALEIAYQAARLLRHEFGAKKIILFGSLTKPNAFNQWSDIDLAAWGIPGDRFYEAVAAVTGLSPILKIDLIDPNYCRPVIRDSIEQEGLIL